MTDRPTELSGQYSLIRFQAGVLARELNKLALGTVPIDRPLILEHQLALNTFQEELKVLQKYLLEARHE